MSSEKYNTDGGVMVDSQTHLTLPAIKLTGDRKKRASEEERE